MSILKVIKERRSVRRYRQDPIPEEVLLRVLDAARFSPSGKNLQPWKFILVKEETLKQRLTEAWCQRGTRQIQQRRDRLHTHRSQSIRRRRIDS